MTFCEKLNNYIEQLECSSQELANASGLSSAVISRYRNGERTPNIKSKQLESLSNGLHKISIDKKVNISKEEIYNALANTLSDIVIDFEQLSKNFSELVSTLNISIADLARSIGYDSSFVSRIRTGSRNPSKPKEFIESVSSFIVAKYSSPDNKKAVSILINCELEDLNDSSKYNLKLMEWLSTNSVPTHNYINDFLNNLDTFDLNQYIKAIHFDEMKVPFVPFYKQASKNYYGIEEMKKGELDFFKATVLSKSTEPVFMCSDMPMEDMAKDVEFGKKWMFGIACMLKKGIHLDIIHNLDRPFNEMMLGLESWIPIYMTGQITPYYFKDIKTNIYQNLTYTSQTLALSGESINGHHNKGKYYLTNNKKEVEYYQEKAKNLLKKATPLMDIYKNENIDSYNNFLKKYYEVFEPRTRFLSSLPLFTITDTLLTSILKRNKLKKSDIDTILNYKNECYINYTNILNTSSITDNIHVLTKEEFKNSLSNLLLSDIFYNKRITYTYEEYLSHLKETETFSKKNPNYKLNKLSSLTFKNITVTIVNKKFVIISKEENPTIHFIIRHPKLVNAISSFKPIVKEAN